VKEVGVPGVKYGGGGGVNDAGCAGLAVPERELGV
jgi:hypothetical protein